MIQKAAENANPLVMEIETDPEVCAEIAARHQRCERNLRWLEANAAEVYSNRGKFICIAGQELFVGGSPEEVLFAAEASHPEDDGRFTLFIPLEKVPRVYASNHFALVVDRPGDAVCLLSRGEVYQA
ncbi:MAG: hypothetical protein B7Z73_10985 [Planctomycetia bacterium 21-64-5]|nr:MAG: hypothetical protein B7Z73_10985 [Planctomycetia bacterium 21-64-5]HQU42310.1 hypothetical protein [Pirellulales bacterium]